ncbi:hypothetical protein ACFWVP_34255 [Streptomyces sp. NPDC058637]|uniref:hypothetical protein n=1 Tax=Streptomyces sp. NPDC058637 TaxID=3346569 RepID=UPI00365B83CF
MKWTDRSLTYAACTAAVLLGLSGAVAQAVEEPTTTAPSAGTAATVARSAPAPIADTQTRVRIVAPGERVAVTRDASVWLTGDRRICDQVMRVKGCYPLTDVDRPYVGLVTGTGTSERQHWIGEFEVPGAARLVVRDAGGAHEGTLVTLAGKPGWGAWTAEVSPYKDGVSVLPDSLTVYDSAGRILVEKNLSGS